jgi:hypothetical protein
VERVVEICSIMTGYPEKIGTRADIIRFFAYLHCDRDIAYHPDDSFSGYVNFDTGEPTFTDEECVRFDQLMDACHEWCKKHKQDIYELGMEANGFFDRHVRLTDRKRIRAYFDDLLGDAYDPFEGDSLIALHTYDEGCWIEEFTRGGKTFFDCIIDNTNPCSDNLREIEVNLFDGRAQQGLRPRQSRRR